MSDQGVPAQWAADPSGRHRFRYWDGARWTPAAGTRRLGGDGGVMSWTAA